MQEKIIKTNNSGNKQAITERNNSDVPEIKMYPASEKDFDTLTDISRICFPEQLRWKITKAHNRKWWENLINTLNSEICVCSLHGRVIAYIVFAPDRIEYEDAWDKQSFTFLDCLLIFMSSPKQFINKMYVKLKRHKAAKIKNPESSEYDDSENTYKKIRSIMAESKPWCGPIALLPDVRGKGISLKMMEHCFQRAGSLGHNEIYTAVRKDNIMSRVMVAIAGFNVIDEAGYLIFYKKNL